MRTRPPLPAALSKPSLAAVFLVMACLYAFTSPVEFLTTDGAVRELIARNMLYHGDVALRQAEAGEVLNNLWSTGPDGRPYAYFGIGQSLLLIPAYVLYDGLEALGAWRYFSAAGTFPMMLVMLISAAFAAACLYGCARECSYEQRPALWVALLAGFGTCLWVLARQNFDMVQEAAGVLGAFYLILKARNQPQNVRPWWLIAGGLCYGLALITRISALMAGPALALLLLWPADDQPWPGRIRAAVLFGLGAAALAWMVPAYNWVRFGSITEFGYSGHGPYAGGPLIAGLLQWTLSPWQGALIYSPFLVLLPFVLPSFNARRPDVLRAILALTACYLIFYAQFTYLGKYGWGPYYILPPLLMLCLPFAELFQAWQGRPGWLRAAFSLGVMLAAAAQIVSLATPTERYQTLLAVTDADVPYTEYYDLRFTPIRMQAQAGAASLHNLFTDPTPYLDQPPDFRGETLLAELYAYNLPDWWWLYHYLKGGLTGLLVPLLAGLALAWLIWQLTRPTQQAAAPTDAQPT